MSNFLIRARGDSGRDPVQGGLPRVGGGDTTADR